MCMVVRVSFVTTVVVRFLVIGEMLVIDVNVDGAIDRAVVVREKSVRFGSCRHCFR